MVDLDVININFFKKYLHLRIDQKVIRRGNEIMKKWNGQNYATINHP